MESERRSVGSHEDRNAPASPRVPSPPSLCIQVPFAASPPTTNQSAIPLAEMGVTTNLEFLEFPGLHFFLLNFKFPEPLCLLKQSQQHFARSGGECNVPQEPP